MDIIITAIAKPFTAYPRGPHKFLIQEDDVVLVWDPIAGYYTSCHSLSARSQARIRRLAREEPQSRALEV